MPLLKSDVAKVNKFSSVPLFSADCVASFSISNCHLIPRSTDCSGLFKSLIIFSSEENEAKSPNDVLFLQWSTFSGVKLFSKLPNGVSNAFAFSGPLTKF